MSRTKILISVHTLEFGGSVVSAFYLGRELVKRGYQVEVVAPAVGPMRERFENGRMRVKIDPSLLAGEQDSRIDSYVGQFDVVYCSNVFSHHVLGTAWGLGVPTVYAIRGNAINEHQAAGVTRWHFQDASCVVFVSGVTRDQHSDWISGVTHTVIPNAIDVDECDEFRRTVSNDEARRQLGIPLDSFVVLNIGSFIEYKDQMTLLKTGPCLETSKIMLCLVGASDYRDTGVYEQELRRTAAQLRHIEYKFFPKRPDPLIYYVASDCVVLCSKTEGSPRVVLEAMAMRRPIITTPVGAVPKIITSGENGIIFQVGDHRALASTIWSIYLKPEAYMPMVEEAYTFVRAYHRIGDMVDQYETIFRRLL